MQDISDTTGNPGKARAGSDRGAIHDLVYAEIHRSLMLGSFAPGEKVSLRSLAEQLGVSLTPVRSAISRLIAEGAFETLPNRWVATPNMTVQRFDEIVHWRVEMETEATRMAVRNVTRSLTKLLESFNRKLVKEVAASGGRRAILGLNYDFHFAIYRASKSPVLLPMIESLWLQAGPFSYYSLDSPEDIWNAKHHERILEGFHDQDERAAVAGIKDDILATAKFLRERGRFGKPRVRRVVSDT